MKKQSGAYRHFIPKLALAIERGTSRVPPDGKFHIVKSGRIVQSFRSRKLAEERFRELVTESGFKPEVADAEQTGRLDESVERYLLAKAIFWAEGPKYKGKGGRGGRGGV